MMQNKEITAGGGVARDAINLPGRLDARRERPNRKMLAKAFLGQKSEEQLQIPKFSTLGKCLLAISTETRIIGFW